MGLYNILRRILLEVFRHKVEILLVIVLNTFILIEAAFC